MILLRRRSSKSTSSRLRLPGSSTICVKGASTFMANLPASLMQFDRENCEMALRQRAGERWWYVECTRLLYEYFRIFSEADIRDSSPPYRRSSEERPGLHYRWRPSEPIEACKESVVRRPI